MKDTEVKKPVAIWTFLKNLLLLALCYFLTEALGALLLAPQNLNGLAFGGLWALLISAVCLLLPRLTGRIVFGITYYLMLGWTLAQVAYVSVFDRMMWLKDIAYASEGVGYLGDIIAKFPVMWWLGGVLLIALGVVQIWKFPKAHRKWLPKLPYIAVAAVSLVALFLLPEVVFLRDNDVWGTRSEYGQSSSYRATYETMYDARKVYNICGMYQLTVRDIWKNFLYPLTPMYLAQQETQTEQIDEYFANRGSQDNDMTGMFAGKNVVLVLMESIDDWMITPEDTPTLYRMMNQGINFTDFYTPGFGTARTINSEFCVNTGIYLPTNGDYLFDYVNNTFNQSFASQAAKNGYNAQVFHYNTGEFYSRGVFEKTMGYEAYNSYADYTSDKDSLYDDCYLFDNQALNDLFFRQGKTFNTIITRSAHLSYKYNEVLSNYALRQYPEYKGKYASEEEDCARVKAKLVDDMFARLLQELESHGQLEDTVVIAVTDHYTYGYKNTDELYALSGVEDQLLLEKTPCFVWSADCEAMTVEKTLNTSDFLPTMLNLMGFDSSYAYLGQDAFDPRYEGYVFLPNGSWIYDGVIYDATDSSVKILEDDNHEEVTQQWLNEMDAKAMEYIKISNLLLTSDYYKD